MVDEMTNEPIPFDLEAAKSGAKVITRDGRPVRILCFDRVNPTSSNSLPIVALVSYGDHEELIACYESGRLYQHRDHNLDLFMAPKPKRKVMVPECWSYKYKEIIMTAAPDERPEHWNHIPAHEVEIEE